MKLTRRLEVTVTRVDVDVAEVVFYIVVLVLALLT